MVFYHKEDCNGLDSRFSPSVNKNKAGYYVGMSCPECGVSTRESGYYNTEAEAWSDYNLMVQGLPITNPRAPETEDEQLIRRLKAAGLDPKPDEENDLDVHKPAKVIITKDGEVDIKLEDPMGTVMHLRLHVTPWGLLGTTNTGFGSIVTDDGFLVIVPESDHTQASVEGLEQEMIRINEMSEEVNQDTPNIDAESIL